LGDGFSIGRLAVHDRNRKCAYFILKAKTETRAFLVSIQKATCRAKATGGKADSEYEGD
jgi:hypothetical protein